MASCGLPVYFVPGLCPKYWSFHFKRRNLARWLNPPTFPSYVIGPFYAFRKVFLNISSSLSRNLLSSAISSHLELLGPRPRFLSRFSYSLNYLMKVALISRSGLLEFKNSNVFSRDHLYLRIMNEAITQDERLYPLTEWTNTLS